MLAARTVFREYALDGARLFFHPASGTHVRVQTRATAASRREAPRVAMFGITNACNLRCDFCSRDVGRPSLWSAESAFAVLSGLARAGTLEVAFGGGEPFAFRGFADLVDALHRETPLAIHVTTNGTLLDDRSWEPFAGRFGIVRLSIYEGEAWRASAALLGKVGQRFGANLLIDEDALPGLPARLETLAELGCHDVSLLSYVGVERDLTLSGRQGLARIIEASPLPVRLSVCFGERIPVARLFAGMDDDGDCGAGYDFVSITPDQRVQSCSFQDESVPGRTAEEILAAWRTQRDAWRTPSPRSGCARAGDAEAPHVPSLHSAPVAPRSGCTRTRDATAPSAPSRQGARISLRSLDARTGAATAPNTPSRQRVSLPSLCARAEDADAPNAQSRQSTWVSLRSRGLPATMGHSHGVGEAPRRGSFPALAVWQSFAGNNSGECTLVAKFGTPADAERYLADLLPSWSGDGPYPAPWRDLFEAEGVAGTLVRSTYHRDGPVELVAIGATVVARGSAADDAFPELRALAWKRGAFVAPGGIHEHGSPWMLAAIRGHSVEDVRALAQRAEALAVRAYPHGERLLLRLDPLGPDRAPSFDAVKATLETLAEGRPLAFEPCYADDDEATLIAAKQRWEVPVDLEPRLWVRFWSYDRAEAELWAAAFARSLGDQPLTRCGPYVLLEKLRGRKRLAVLAYRRNGAVTPLERASVEVGCTLWNQRSLGRKRGKSTFLDSDFAAFEAKVRDRVTNVETLTIQRNSDRFIRSITITGRTRAPAAMLQSLWELTNTLAYERHVWMRDPDPLHAVLQRLADDLTTKKTSRQR